MAIHAALRALILGWLVLLTGCANQTSLPNLTERDDLSHPLAYDVLMEAFGQLGAPYRYAGSAPETGFDCSGLIGYVYRNAAGITLPRSTRELIRLPAPPIDRTALAPGDLVFFAINRNGRVNHAGIYVGDGRFVHAPSNGGSVRLDQLSQKYWQRRYLGARRILALPEFAQR